MEKYNPMPHHVRKEDYMSLQAELADEKKTKIVTCNSFIEQIKNADKILESLQAEVEGLKNLLGIAERISTEKIEENKRLREEGLFLANECYKFYLQVVKGAIDNPPTKEEFLKGKGLDELLEGGNEV